MNVKNVKIGIWGYGIVGKSAVNYLRNCGAQLEIFTDSSIAESDRIELTHKGVTICPLQEKEAFFQRNSYILPSPGINLLPYQVFTQKWLAELDLFGHAYPNPIIAVTGTVGKTSVTHLLSQLLSAHGKQVLTGGNIGVGMFDLLSLTAGDMALLETSSFQLELCKNFAPDLSIWTTFSDNHLDRHGTMRSYFEAKYKIVQFQKADQKALLPINLLPYLKEKEKPASTLYFFAQEKPTPESLKEIDRWGNLFFTHENMLILRQDNQEQILIDLRTLPALTFRQNWFIITSALYLLNMPLDQLAHHAQTVSIPEHRLERVAVLNGITFYNDSKSTTPPSTQAAIANFNAQPIHLFLGGLSKGIDRTPLIQKLSPHVAHVYCFGKEASDLHQLCVAAGKTSSAHTTLEDAFAHAMTIAKQGSIILLSPGGSSYDLFTDYMHRGKRFKELVDTYAKQI